MARLGPTERAVRLALVVPGQVVELLGVLVREDRLRVPGVGEPPLRGMGKRSRLLIHDSVGGRAPLAQFLEPESQRHLRKRYRATWVDRAA